MTAVRISRRALFRCTRVHARGVGHGELAVKAPAYVPPRSQTVSPGCAGLALESAFVKLIGLAITPVTVPMAFRPVRHAAPLERRRPDRCRKHQERETRAFQNRAFCRRQRRRRPRALSNRRR